jgi:hypothetical protein
MQIQDFGALERRTENDDTAKEAERPSISVDRRIPGGDVCGLMRKGLYEFRDERRQPPTSSSSWMG